MHMTRSIVFVLFVSSLGVPRLATASTVSPENGAGGELLCRMGDQLVPMPLLTMDVDIQVDGIMSTARLTQRFDNRATATIEAIYVFPLPEHAALHHMEIRIGDRRIVSRVEEREVAKQVYETARTEGKKTALVEQERPNLFTTSVGNLNPGEAVEVILEYVEEVGYEAGTFGVGFPMTFTPRYTPTARSTREEASGLPTIISSIVPDADRVTPAFREADAIDAPHVRFRATIRPGIPVNAVRCPSHPTSVTENEGIWTIAPIHDTVLADRDLRLEWAPKIDGEPRTAFLTQPDGSHSYGLLMLVPPDAGPADAGLPTRTLFVIDVSGSMAGPSIEQARQALDTALLRLRATDSFNILAFNQEQHLYRERWTPGDALEIAQARGWVQELNADGGTEIHPALLRGIRLFGSGDDAAVSRLVFLTDGAVDNEFQVLADVVSKLGPIRLHAVGIGHAPNRFFIRKLAERGHGLSTFIFDQNTLNQAMQSFLHRVERPVLTDLTIDGVQGAEMHPGTLTDLHAGEPLFVSLSWEGPPPASVNLRGRWLYGPYGRRIPVSPAGPDNAGISTRWARAKIEDLMDSLLGGAHPDSVRRAVASVGMKHHLVTRYTSLVAVEEQPTATGAAASVQVANALPHGSQLLGSLPQGGTLDRLRRWAAGALLLLGLGSLWRYRRGSRHAVPSV